MPVSRRRFIKFGAMASVTAGFLSPFNALAQKRIQSGPLMDYFEIPSEAKQVPFSYYRRATFEPYVGGIFTARDARGRIIKLKLVRIAAYAPDPRTRITTGTSRDTECFSLRFKASSALPPFSSIQKIEHPVLGSFDLFLIRSDKNGLINYEATINHLD